MPLVDHDHPHGQFGRLHGPHQFHPQFQGGIGPTLFHDAHRQSPIPRNYIRRFLIDPI